MTCEECIHKEVCYRVDSVKNDYAQKCGDFVSGCKPLEQEPCDELDFVQPHKKVSVNLEVCKMREATLEEREGVDQYIDSIAEPCEDAISREAVLDLCDSKDPDYKVIHFKEDVECLPSVNPQPKMGRWILTQRDKCIDVSCSECGNTRFKDYACGYTIDEINDLLTKFFHLNFCECCGAKIQEVIKNDER